jgi:hypothetical protein
MLDSAGNQFYSVAMVIIDNKAYCFRFFLHIIRSRYKCDCLKSTNHFIGQCSWQSVICSSDADVSDLRRQKHLNFLSSPLLLYRLLNILHFFLGSGSSLPTIYLLMGSMIFFHLAILQTPTLQQQERFSRLN